MFDFTCTTHHILLGISCILNSAAIIYNSVHLLKLRKDLCPRRRSFKKEFK